MILSRLFLLVLIAATPSNGAAPTNTAPSPIPREKIASAILSDLVYSTPHLDIFLDEARPSAAIDNLVRAKILRVIGKTAGSNVVPKGLLVLMLTARGERIALNRGWAFGSAVLQIPTGRLSYVAGSYSVQREKDDSASAYVTYFWRFKGNSNLAYLLRLGTLSTWPRSMFTSCILDGLRHAPPQSRKILIVRSSLGVWSPFAEGARGFVAIHGCVTGK